jgi:hypothetical protein
MTTTPSRGWIANAISRDRVQYRGVDPTTEFVEGYLYYDHYIQLLTKGT